MPDRPLTSAGSRLRDCVVIALVAGAAALLLRPFQNTPFIDDWVYAWSVERLLSGGGLRFMEYSSNPNLVQVLWGALFCLPFGFSFTALRISTYVLGVSGVIALYLSLRELDVSRRDSLVGAAVLATYPVYFLLSITFMTDVPFLALAVWSCFFFVRAVRTGRDGWLVAFAGAACLASGVRMIGVVLPAAACCVMLFQARDWGRRVIRVAVVLAPVLVTVLLTAWYRGHLERIADASFMLTMASRLDNLKWGLLEFPQALPADVTFSTELLGIAMIALSAGCVQRNQLARAGYAFIVLVLILLGQSAAGSRYFAPHVDTSIWALRELGSAAPFIAGYQELQVPPWAKWGLVVSATALGAPVVSFLCRRHWTKGAAIFLWFLIANFLLLDLLWLFYDRYGLVLVPGAIILILCTAPIVRPAWSIALTIGFASLCFVGTRDHLTYNSTVWRGIDDLRRRGARDSEISGGYVVNGWLQYAHPDQAPRDRHGNVEVPGVNSDRELKFEVANAPMPHYRIVDKLPYRLWLGKSGAIYLLERIEATHDARAETSRQ